MSLTIAGITFPCATEVVDFASTGLTWPVGICHVSRRADPPTQIVIHVTGGEGSGQQVHRALTRRGYSVPFASDPIGTVWQYLDPAWFVAAHTGGLNARSIGIEVVNIGRPAIWRRIPPAEWPNPYHRPLSSGYVHAVDPQGVYQRSSRAPMLGLLPDQLAGLRALVTALCGQMGIPCVRADLRPYIPRGERAGLRGVLGHVQVTTAHGDPSLDAIEWVEPRS